MGRGMLEVVTIVNPDHPAGSREVEKSIKNKLKKSFAKVSGFFCQI